MSPLECRVETTGHMSVDSEFTLTDIRVWSRYLGDSVVLDDSTDVYAWGELDPHESERCT